MKKVGIIVIHCGAPFIVDVGNPQTELLEPTIKGTEINLEAFKNKFRIEKVVFIALVAAWETNFLIPAARKIFTNTFDESDAKFKSPEIHQYEHAKFTANTTVEKLIIDNSSLSCEIN